MSYKFKKYNLSSLNEPENERDYDYGVDFDSLSKGEIALFQINSHEWTSEEVQRLMDEIKSLEGDNYIQYQVEGGHLLIVADKEETHLFNLLNREQRKADIIWSTEKFNKFLKEIGKRLLIFGERF